MTGDGEREFRTQSAQNFGDKMPTFTKTDKVFKTKKLMFKLWRQDANVQKDGQGFISYPKRKDNILSFLNKMPMFTKTDKVSYSLQLEMIIF